MDANKLIFVTNKKNTSRSNARIKMYDHAKSKEHTFLEGVFVRKQHNKTP